MGLRYCGGTQLDLLGGFRATMTAMNDVAHRRPLDLLDAFHRAMVALSADGLADLHASDAVYEFPLLTPGRPERYRGREEIRAGFREVWAGASAHLRVTQIRNVVVHETTDPEVLVVEHEALATLIGNDERIVVPSLIIIKACNGLLVHVRDYSAGTRRPDFREA